METSRLLLDILTAVFLVVTLLGLLLKRDKQDKYLLWTLLIPPLSVIYFFVMPEFSANRPPSLSPFESQALVYQGVAVVLALVSRLENQAGPMAFWLATFLNLGTCGFLVYYARFWTM